MKKIINLEKLITEKFGNKTLILIQDCEKYNYGSFVNTILQYLPDFTEAHAGYYDAYSKNTILENPGSNSTYGVLFNFSTKNARIRSYNKTIYCNQYMFGSFSIALQEAELIVSFDDFLKYIKSSSSFINEDNNLNKDSIYLTYQMHVYEKEESKY